MHTTPIRMAFLSTRIINKVEPMVRFDQAPNWYWDNVHIMCK